MKLYTEEQVLKAMNDYANTSSDLDNVINVEMAIIEQLTPIELPSDEEIYELMDNLPFSKHIGDELFNNGQRKGFELGIKYIRHQILNQNK
jgi:hypothetical protein